MKKFLLYTFSSIVLVFLLLISINTINAPVAKAAIPPCNTGGSDLQIAGGLSNNIFGKLPGVSDTSAVLIIGCLDDLNVEQKQTLAKEHNLVNDEGVLDKQKATEYLQSLGATQGEVDKYITKLEQAADNIKKSAFSCNINNSLSFILCPINQIITDMLTVVIETMASLLSVDSFGFSGSDGLQSAQSAVLTIANSIFIVLFLFIIFANFVAIPGLDNYTIKKTLPKLIVAIILAQFAFFICLAIADLSNIAGATIPNEIAEAYFCRQGGPGIANISNIGVGTNGCTDGVTVAEAVNEAFNPFSVSSLDKFRASGSVGLGLILFSQIIIIAALVLAVIALIYIMFRQFGLIALIIIAPVALVAWVLPGTAKYTKQWLELYIKLCLMYLIVMLIIVFSAIVSDILKSIAQPDGPLPNPSELLVFLTAVAMPLVALILIPKAFKWSSKAVTASGSLIANSTAGKTAKSVGKSAAKTSAKEGRLAEVKGGAFARVGKSVGGAKGLKLQAHGEALKKEPGKKIQGNLESLGLEKSISEKDNIDPAIKGAANRIIAEKRKELLSARALDAQGQYNWLRINGNEGTLNPATKERTITTTDKDGKQVQLIANEKGIVTKTSVNGVLTDGVGTSIFESPIQQQSTAPQAQPVAGPTQTPQQQPPGPNPQPTPPPGGNAQTTASRYQQGRNAGRNAANAGRLGGNGGNPQTPPPPRQTGPQGPPPGAP